MLIKPTLEELQEDIYHNISGRVCPDQPFMLGGVLRVISNAIAYGVWAVYEFSDRLGRTPWDAQGQLLYNYGLGCGITPNEETCSSGIINISGSGEIPAGSTLTRCDGCEYETIDTYIIPGDAVVVRSIDCGSLCNSPNGTILTFSNAPAGIDSTTQVNNDGLVGGSDAETDEEFRLRVLSCLANPCRTGLKSDYDFWTRLHPGVTRVCCESQANGCGTVKVYFTMDETYVDGIPAQGDVEAVQEILNDNVPLGVCATACAPVPKVVNVKIKVQRSTQAQRIEIKDVLQQFFQNIQCEIVCLADLIRVVSEVYPQCFEICEPETNQLNIGINEVLVLGNVTFVSF